VATGLVPVLTHQVTIYADIELTVGAGDKIKGANVLVIFGEGLTCHPGSSQGVASILAVEYLY
jgi:hypothetical protein